jgi:hypothetical protein
MGKRRRERDRPKYGPEAVYNPNKRVLLSYSSEEDQADDIVDANLGSGHAQAANDIPDNYEIAPYPNDAEDESDDVSVPATASMPIEVTKNGGELQEEADERPEGTGKFMRSASKNPITGQWPALGSLAYSYDDEEEGEGPGGDGQESDEGDDEEAMAYLRAVRYDTTIWHSLYSHICCIVNS